MGRSLPVRGQEGGTILGGPSQNGDLGLDQTCRTCRRNVRGGRFLFHGSIPRFRPFSGHFFFFRTFMEERGDCVAVIMKAARIGWASTGEGAFEQWRCVV